ncbi:MAG: ribonuclease III [Methylocystaceae bacterium]
MNRENRSAREFIRVTGVEFAKQELLVKALTHPSYSQEHEGVVNNQRLEFLGDSVLNLVVAEYLFLAFPLRAEGDLTKMRARVVCEKALAQMAVKLQLGDYLLLGKGEEMSGGRERHSILADGVEAVIGAVYLDKGLEFTREFILKYLSDDIAGIAAGNFYDYKSRLQEVVQSRCRENVTYTILEENGPAHNKTFVAGVLFHGKLLATGNGKSKKEAEQNAAETALSQNINYGDPESIG